MEAVVVLCRDGRSAGWDPATSLSSMSIVHDEPMPFINCCTIWCAASPDMTSFLRTLASIWLAISRTLRSSLSLLDVGERM